MRISLVNGICVRHDAISETVRGTALALAAKPGVQVRLFTYMSDYTDIDVQRVGSCTDILFDRFFIESDLILYHFGIYYDLFNTILLGNGRAPQVVRYHNVTPKEFMQPNQHSLVDKSLRQITNMVAASRIWADSRFNKRHLIDYGIDPGKIDVSPLYVKRDFEANKTAEKHRDVVRILYVGRFVKSKGLLDLLEAVKAVRVATRAEFRLDLVGNLTLSDPAYLAAVRAMIARDGLDDIVHIHGNVDDAALWERFLASHIFIIPSYHEGFCVPAIEALCARCLPIAYDSGNLPDIVGGVGEIVRTGDVAALAERLLRHVVFFHEQNHRPAPEASVPFKEGSCSLQALWDRLERRALRYTYQAFSSRLQDAVQQLT